MKHDQADYMFDAADDDLSTRKRFMLYCIAGFFTMFILWANVAKLDEVTRGEGKIIPSSEIKVIQHREGGIVESILVNEGQIVERGAILIRLKDIDANAELQSTNVKLLGLRARAARLRAEADGKDTVEFPEDIKKNAPKSVAQEMEAFRANKTSLNNQIGIMRQQLAQRQQEVTELQSRASDLREVIELSRQEKAMIEPLVARGSAPQIELVQLERALKEKTSELNGVEQALPRAKSAIAEAQARQNEVMNGARAEAQSQLSETQLEINTIDETVDALEDRKTRTEIVAPVKGTIKDIKINTISGVVKPGEDLIEIVPHDDQLLVEAHIRPSDIAFLYPGQPAVIKITAYDFSIYGGLKGEVVDISADTITNEKDENFYRVRLNTDETEIRKNGKVLPIIPGMVAGVDILTGKKTVMEYLLKPFIKTMDSALNER